MRSHPGSASWRDTHDGIRTRAGWENFSGSLPKKWQARPYDEKRRYNLGLFPTREAAMVAIQEFWWGRRPERPRFVMPVHRKDGSTDYRAVVVLGRKSGGVVPPGKCVEIVRLGVFATSEKASAAVRKYITGRFPPDRAAELLAGGR